jgi:hypothetical protein
VFSMDDSHVLILVKTRRSWVKLAFMVILRFGISTGLGLITPIAFEAFLGGF